MERKCHRFQELQAVEKISPTAESVIFVVEKFAKKSSCTYKASSEFFSLIHIKTNDIFKYLLGQSLRTDFLKKFKDIKDDEIKYFNINRDFF